MHRYLVWCPDRGHSQEDGVVCGNNPYASHRDAAEQWAHYHAGFDGDPFDEIIVHVREADRDSAPTHEITVTVRADPVFAAVSQRVVQVETGPRCHCADGGAAAIRTAVEAERARILGALRAVPVEHLQRESVSYIQECDANAVRAALIAAVEASP